jgi:hypothetical protein
VSATVDYEDLLLAFAMDLVAISILTYALYFPRHRRRDLTLGFIGVNIGLFAVSSFTAENTISVGFGIGLFALLSVIRLRSTVASQEEIGYYFVGLVLGIVNGMSPQDSWGIALLLNCLLLAVIFVADHPRLLPHAERTVVLIDGVPRRRETLRKKVEQRIGYEVTQMHVVDVDYVRRQTRVDVRFRTDRPVKREKQQPPAPTGEPALDEGTSPPSDDWTGDADLGRQTTVPDDDDDLEDLLP